MGECPVAMTDVDIDTCCLGRVCPNLRQDPIDPALKHYCGALITPCQMYCDRCEAEIAFGDESQEKHEDYL